MRLNGRKTLVTGAGGFIGSHLVELLAERGCRVRAMLHYDARSGRSNLDLVAPELLAAIDVVSGDIADPYFVHEAVAGCSVVFHLAALVGVPYSYSAPAAYVATNTQGTLHVLEACRRTGIERLVHTSTSECYGTALTTPIDETHRLQGQSPYAASKIAADKLAEAYHLSFDVPVAVLRPFNTYGPRQSPRAIIPQIVAQLLAGVPELQLGALSPTRDFLYVRDTCEAFCRVAEVDEAVGQVINVGTGREISVGELARLLMDIVGVERPIVQDPARLRPLKSEVRTLVCDASRGRRVLGWSPATDLRAGLSRVVDFMRAHPQLVRGVGEYHV